MGVVYSAYDPNLDRTVAVKLLRGDAFDLRERAAAGQRLRREAQSMAQVAHPNVVPVFDVGEHEDRVYIAMELVEGRSLDAWLTECARPYREVLGMYFQAGLGLAAAHEAGILHRDFKPTNVLVGHDRRARVVDFGLARPTPLEPSEGVLADFADIETTIPQGERADTMMSGITRTGVVAGTPAYMAPELHTGGAADARADQFAFCIALYEALYGERPFAGKTVFAIAERMLAGDVRPEPPLTRVPVWLRAVLVKGLSPDPERRYPSVKALLAAIAFMSRIVRE